MAKTASATFPAATGGTIPSTAEPGAIHVVIPARQAAAYLPACLAGTRAAGFAPGEVTVVDDGSTDGTAGIAREAGVRVVSGPRRGAAAARNAGARAAIGAGAEILVFVDADVVPGEDARAVIAEVLGAGGEVAAVFGAYDARPAAPGAVSRFRNLLHRHVHLQNAGPAATFWTGLGAVRRGAFEAAGGFDPGQRMMEDVKFGMALARAGHAIQLDPRLQGTHLKAWSLAGMVRTDLLDRAIPWSRLLLSQGAALPRGLNTAPAARASVLCAGVLLLCLPGLLVRPLGAAGLGGAALLVLAAVNGPFLSRLRREAGAGLALLAVPLLAVHYACGGAGYAWARITTRR